MTEFGYSVDGRWSDPSTDVFGHLVGFIYKERERALQPLAISVPYLTRAQLDREKKLWPHQADWLEANTVIVELMDANETLLEMVGKTHGLNQENPDPPLNRADRRRLRNGKTR